MQIIVSNKEFYFWLLAIYIFNISFIYEVRPAEVVEEASYFSFYIVLKASVVVFLGIYALYEVLHMKITLFKKFRNYTVYFLLYVFLAFISVFWSASITFTLYRAFELLTGLILVYLYVDHITGELSYKTEYLRMIYFYLFIVLLNIITLRIVSGESLLTEGFWIDNLRNNSASMIGGMLFIYGALASKVKNSNFIHLLTGLFFLLLFRSTASFLFTLIALSIVWFRNKGISAIGGSLTVIFILIFWDSIIQLILYLDPGKTAENFETLTGRIFLWIASIKLILNKFLLGYGFGTERLLLFSLPGVWSALNIHNGYLASFFSLGVVGFAVLTAIIVKISRQLTLFNKTNKDLGKIILAGFILVLFNNLTISGLGSIINISWIIIAFFSFGIRKLGDIQPIS